MPICFAVIPFTDWFTSTEKSSVPFSPNRNLEFLFLYIHLLRVFLRNKGEENARKYDKLKFIILWKSSVNLPSKSPPPLHIRRPMQLIFNFLDAPTDFAPFWRFLPHFIPLSPLFPFTLLAKRKTLKWPINNLRSRNGVPGLKAFPPLLGKSLTYFLYFLFYNPRILRFSWVLQSHDHFFVYFLSPLLFSFSSTFSRPV